MEGICLQQSEIITQLSALCKTLVEELSQFKTIEAEELQLKNLIEQEDSLWNT